MADPRFYQVAGPFTLSELAEASGSEIAGNVSLNQEFHDILPLETATKSDVSFIDNRKYVDAFLASKAGAILTPPDLIDQAPPGTVLLINKQPYLGYAKLTQVFYPTNSAKESSIKASAVIDATAKIGDNVSVESGVVIGPNVEIGNNSSIGPNTYIGQGVVIGNDCHIGSNVTLIYCIIGDNNIIHAGVCIGQDGYGFAPGMPRHTKVNQLGRVLIGDDVEIGANTAIDRGAGPDTVIGDGTKIDNLVHVAHNVQIGRGCFITGQNGFAGSAIIGDYVMMGGQVGVSGHITVGDGVQIAAQSGVSTDIAPGEVVAGTPAQNAREHWKGLAMLRKLVKAKRGK